MQTEIFSSFLRKIVDTEIFLFVYVTTISALIPAIFSSVFHFYKGFSKTLRLRSKRNGRITGIRLFCFLNLVVEKQADEEATGPGFRAWVTYADFATVLAFVENYRHKKRTEKNRESERLLVI